MKNLLIITLAVILTGCSTASPQVNNESSSSNEEENITTEVSPLFCGEIFSNRTEDLYADGRIPEDITAENLLKQDSSLPKESKDLILSVFDNSEFQDVIADSDLMNFCFYPEHFVFSSFGWTNFDERAGSNTVGSYSNGNLALSYVEDFAPGHEFNACKITKLTDNKLTYTCETYDRKTTHELDLKSEKTTLVDEYEYESFDE